MKSEKWTSERIPDQSSRVAIVTGSSSGIGFETARVLARKGAEVIIAIRNLDKGNAAAKRIQEQDPNADIKVMLLDLADLGSVKRFAEAFKAANARLDLLINNAGVMIPPYTKTADGFELQFGTNHLGHFALTGHLLELLINTQDARVVNVSSGMHKTGRLDFDDLNWESRRYKAWRAYGDSKIANLYFTYSLDKKLKNMGVDTISTASHPGWTATELQRHAGLTQLLNGIFAQDVPTGALPTLRAATEPGLKGGEYFGPGGFMELRGYPVRVESNKLSHDDATAALLWETSEKLTGVKFAFVLPPKKTASAGA